MSVNLIIVTPSDGDIVTSYDTGPHTGSLVTGSHDAVKSVKQMLAAITLVKVAGGPE